MAEKAKPRRARKRTAEGSTRSTNGRLAAVKSSDRCLTADQIVEVEQEWGWFPYLPRGLVTLLVGGVGVGKSTFLAAVVAHLTGGRQLETDTQTNPTTVLVYSPEENLATITRPRLRAAGAVLKRVAFGDVREDGSPAPRLGLPADLNRLNRLVQEHRCGAVVFDPVTSYLAQGIDPKDSLGVRAILDGLAEIAQQRHAMVILTVHYRKGREGNPLDWVAGSGAWTQVPRVVIALGTDPDRPTQHVLTNPKNSLRGPQPSRLFALEVDRDMPRFVIGNPTGLVADDLTGSMQEPAERGAMADAVSFLKDRLDLDEQPVKELQRVAEESCIARMTLRRAKERLGITSHHCGTGTSRFLVWRKPESGWPS